MPLAGLALLLLNATCIIHAARRGKSTIWYFAVLALPVIGALAYIVLEMWPEMRGRPSTKRMIKDASWAVKSPDMRYQILSDELKAIPTVENRHALAVECIHQKRYSDAIVILKTGLQGVQAKDIVLLLTLAEAYFYRGDFSACLETFTTLRQSNPDYYKPYAHLLYARALDAAGKKEEALQEFEALAPTYPGQEARCRYAFLLSEMGQRSQARSVADELLRMVQRGNRSYKVAQKEWADRTDNLIRMLESS